MTNTNPEQPREFLTRFRPLFHDRVADVDQALAETIISRAESLAMILMALDRSRAQSLAMTNLEQSVHWAAQALLNRKGE